MPEVKVPQAALAAAATTAATALYLNNSLGLFADLKALREDKTAFAIVTEKIKSLGDYPGLYGLLENAEPNAAALWFEGKEWSYKALKAEVEKVALGLYELGIRANDYVAIFMSNSPEMLFSMYACARIGAVPSMINSALRDDTLLHCVRLPNAKLIISTPDLAPFAASAAKSLSESLQTTCLNLGSFPNLPQSSDIIPFPDSSMSTAQIITPKTTIADAGALIYTSGTTGKPKACSIKNQLICFAGAPQAADMANPTKYLPARTYSCMPIFHGTTFFVGVCQSAATSSCFCIGRRFSARNFWRDIHDSKATRMLYVGELCRFLLKPPPGPFDKNHNCLVALGNGLQADVWLAFQKRFNVPEIREYYRSTDSTVRYDNRHFVSRGSRGVGRLEYIGTLRRRLEKRVYIVKFDYDTEMPYRDPQTGFCVPAKHDEPGEAIARIESMVGYTNYHGNTAATEAKLLRNVFAQGDLFQRSGDLLVHESSGWVRFVDRIGDTFRWRGENVSAGEIRAFLCELPEIHDAIVVGKKLQGYDGQAGAAALTLKSESSAAGGEAKVMKGLYQTLKKKGVPSYAMPRLVVITPGEMTVGDTFKHAKQVVRALNWGGSEGGNKYWLDEEDYKLLDERSWQRIVNGKAKL